MQTINITDFEQRSNNLAKVIVSYTGDIDGDYLKAELSRKLSYLATPVANSFKKLGAGIAVGFIRANKSIRSVSANELKANYRVMASNILMDNEDKTLWDVKDGAAGKYLARRGQEDIASLVSAAVYSRSDIPKLHKVTIARASTEELVAFVDPDGDMDYGFAVATNDEKVRVVSYYRRLPVTIDYRDVVSIHPVAVPRTVKAQVLASMTAKEKANAADYWRRLYSYDKDYMEQTIQQVNEGTVG